MAELENEYEEERVDDYPLLEAGYILHVCERCATRIYVHPDARDTFIQRVRMWYRYLWWPNSRWPKCPACGKDL